MKHGKGERLIISLLCIIHLPYSWLFTRKVIFTNLSKLSRDKNVNRRKICNACYGAYIFTICAYNHILSDVYMCVIFDIR